MKILIIGVVIYAAHRIIKEIGDYFEDVNPDNKNRG